MEMPGVELLSLFKLHMTDLKRDLEHVRPFARTLVCHPSFNKQLEHMRFSIICIGCKVLLEKVLQKKVIAKANALD
eukprot:c26442_g1_i1 orf=94-321(+)